MGLEELAWGTPWSALKGLLKTWLTLAICDFPVRYDENQNLKIPLIPALWQLSRRDVVIYQIKCFAYV